MTCESHEDYPIKDLADAWALASRVDADGTAACGVRLSIERRMFAVLRSPHEHVADWAFNTILHEIHLQGQLHGINTMAASRRKEVA